MYSLIYRLVYSLIYSLNSNSGRFRYGMLTTAQVIPGFIAFLGARALLWMVLGDSKTRTRQFNRRKEILEEYWLKQSSKNFKKQGAFYPSSPSNSSKGSRFASSLPSLPLFNPTESASATVKVSVTESAARKRSWF
jgi:hypothetical protein